MGDERRRRAEHGGVGTPHSRCASGKALGASADKAASFSWRLWARRFVCSVTRRRGGPPAHRPSGRGLGCGFAPDRAIPPPSQAGVGFGLWLGSPVCFLPKLGRRGIKLRRTQGPTGGGVTGIVVVVLHNKNPHTPCLWQAPASTQKTKRKTRPAIRRSARWRVMVGDDQPWGVTEMPRTNWRRDRPSGSKKKLSLTVPKGRDAGDSNELSSCGLLASSGTINKYNPGSREVGRLLRR